MSRLPRRLVAALLAASLLGAAACSDDDDSADTGDDGTTEDIEVSDELKLEAATTYADLVLSAYAGVVESATGLRDAITAFTAAPSEAGLAAAKQAWLDARVLYGPTEVFRFYDGPIDNPEDGPEGQINAWPLDEGYIDYVDGDATAGIINDAATHPEITTDVLVAANEQGGEANISTGWHAIEFLLWGQDLSDAGPGDRPLTDYTTSPVAERRATYLELLADLLVSDLTSVRDAWGPEPDAYRAEFLSDPDQALTNILRGMGALSSGELAGERIAVAVETKEQEDEHSCFSDNTNVDILGNATGIRMVYLADLGGITGTSLSDVVAEVEPDLDAALRELLDTNVAAAAALEGPFDQLILGDDEAPGRVQLNELITGLQDQGDLVAEVAAALGYQVSLAI